MRKLMLLLVVAFAANVMMAQDEDLANDIELMNNYYNVAADEYNSGNYAKAYPLFKKAHDIAKRLGRSDDANEMLNFTAISCMKTGDYATAVTYFVELRDAGAGGPGVYRHMANCYTGLDNNEMALRMLNAGLKKYPRNSDLIVEKVNVYLKEGKGAEAIKDLKKLVKHDPKNEQLHFVLGTIYGDEGNEGVYDTKKAVKYYKKAISINPDYYDANFNLGVLYTSMANKYITQANGIKGFSKKEQKKYNGLIAKSNEMLRTGLPYLKKVYNAQPSDDLKKVLRAIYVKLDMKDEVEALDE